jgi:hypothetical protein
LCDILSSEKSDMVDMGLEVKQERIGSGAWRGLALSTQEEGEGDYEVIGKTEERENRVITSLALVQGSSGLHRR